ncbi:MAG: mechanosensitive ion channel [Deltaproteobacteria bacterium]|nr:mechanosensitive ion channel [Deltaproteobacteria bacterium]
MDHLSLQSLVLLAQSSSRSASTTAPSSPLLTRGLLQSTLTTRLGLDSELARWLERGGMVIVTIALTVLAMRLVPWVERLILRVAARSPLDRRATESEIDMRQRIETLTRVATSLSRTAIFAIAAVMLLGELGLEIKPLLAGAGIAGVAIGFGAQSIVKDYFAGFYILLEDQFDVGDTITLGTITGTVERMSLRITMIRDLNGTAYFVPNSTITQVANKTHSWSRAAVEVTFRASVRVGFVREILGEAAALAKTLEPLHSDPDALVKIIGPQDLDWGGTKWTVAVRAHATLVAEYKLALVEAVHTALEARGFEADNFGRLAPS